MIRNLRPMKKEIAVYRRIREIPESAQAGVHLDPMDIFPKWKTHWNCVIYPVPSCVRPEYSRMSALNLHIWLIRPVWQVVKAEYVASISGFYSVGQNRLIIPRLRGRRFKSYPRNQFLCFSSRATCNKKWPVFWQLSAKLSAVFQRDQYLPATLARPADCPLLCTAPWKY